MTGWIIAGVMLMLAGGGGFYAYQQMQSGGGLFVVATEVDDEPQSTKVVRSTPQKTPPRVSAKAANPIEEISPTDGKPIQLVYMPAGARVIINLHPDEIWGNEPRMAEFRASLSSLGSWLEQQITSLTRQPPSEIEELLIGVLLGPRGTPPEFAGVIHFKEEKIRSELLTTYSGTPYQEFQTDVQIIDGVGYRIIDEKTVSFCPEKYIEDILSFGTSPAVTAPAIEKTLATTDRDALVTVVFDPTDIEQHQQTLFPETAQLAVEKGIRWFGDKASTAAWAVHLKDDFFTELTILGETGIKPYQLRTQYQQRLEAIPELMLTSVQKMEPRRAGYRKIIGRFPAMLKVLALATKVSVDQQFVRLGTLLPPKAGPNLAIGTLLTWDESTRTDFTAKTPVAKTPTEKPKTFQEKLQTKMEVDFRRTPLQEAFAYIADEADIPIIIDGDALKLAGFTKNMPQTHRASDLTTMQAIYTIVQKYEEEADPIVVNVSEEEQRITVLTKKVATREEIETFDFSQLAN